MSSQDEEFDKRRKELVDQHMQGLAANPISGPPDIGPGGSIEDFQRLLGGVARNYTPSGSIKNTS